MKPFPFMIDEDMREKLRKRAFNKQVSMAKLIRDIIQKALKK